VYNSIRVFAELNSGQLASVTQDLKEILGDKLILMILGKPSMSPKDTKLEMKIIGL